MRGRTIAQVLGLDGRAHRTRAASAAAASATGGTLRERGRDRAGYGRAARRALREHRLMAAELATSGAHSSNGANRKQLDTLRSLGLRRIGHTVLQ